MRTRVLDTALGPVEVSLTPGVCEPVVVVFPGGDTTAATPLGTDLYTDLGYRVLAFSRPGYGRSRVGSLTAAEFVPAVMEVCQQLDIPRGGRDRGYMFRWAASCTRRGVAAAPGSTAGVAQLRPVDTAVPGHGSGGVHVRGVAAHDLSDIGCFLDAEVRGNGSVEVDDCRTERRRSVSGLTRLRDAAMVDGIGERSSPRSRT